MRISTAERVPKSLEIARANSCACDSTSRLKRINRSRRTAREGDISVRNAACCDCNKVRNGSPSEYDTAVTANLADPDRQFAETAHERRAHPRRLAHYFDTLETLQNLFPQYLELQFGQAIAHAAMNAEAK
jgi:hypothetical protein